MVKKLRQVCQTGHIGCTAKTLVSVLVNYPTGLCGGVSRGGYAIIGASLYSLADLLNVQNFTPTGLLENKIYGKKFVNLVKI